jgi:hypothetical protein
MRVEKGPDELAAYVFQAKLEMRVLVNGVVAAEEGAGADVKTLFVGDFFMADQARRITGARGRDGGIERMSKGVAESDARRRGFNQFGGIAAFKHARLGGHSRQSFYTGGAWEEVKSRKEELLEVTAEMGRSVFSWRS